MKENPQLPLLPISTFTSQNNNRSGTFIDNMKLPVHRWFRFSAGFSAQWVENLLLEWGFDESCLVLDPFAGSGTTLLAADQLGVPSIGIEAHPFISRIAKAKLRWDTPTSPLINKANVILENYELYPTRIADFPVLIERSFTKDALLQLSRLRAVWEAENDNSNESELVWLAITSILRPSSTAGTAQWQYILPNKTKKVVTEPLDAFIEQVRLMAFDMEAFQVSSKESKANLICGDVRNCADIPDDVVDGVITSPPYANNYDYADATRFEMSFWREVSSWGDLHQAVRKRLIVSTSQHASLEKLELDALLESEKLKPIRNEISDVCRRLEVERLSHGGRKHYHTMIAAYFVDLAAAWVELRRICKPGAKVCFVIGDSAPYGIHVPVETWLGKLAIQAGFRSYRFEKIRDRNIKWKNRKHRVPLHEGRLWVEG